MKGGSSGIAFFMLFWFEMQVSLAIFTIIKHTSRLNLGYYEKSIDCRRQFSDSKFG